MSYRTWILLITVVCLHLAVPFSAVCSSNETIEKAAKKREVSFQFPNFDQSMMRGGKSKITYQRHFGSKLKGPNAEKLKSRLNQLRSLYNSAVSVIKAGAADGANQTHIPRIVHQIWLGSQVPYKYADWMKTWTNWLGWEYKLWTDEEVKKLNLVNQAIYDTVTNYGQKSDILRMELLYMMGGVYVDTDFECLNPQFFEMLHQHVDFYVGIEPMEHAVLRINNAILASAPGHPLMAKMILDLPQHFEANKKKWALISTGPVFMTKVIYNYLEEDHPNELNMFLPCSLVYPFTSSEVDRAGLKSSLNPMPETVAVHYWSKSWVKTSKNKALKSLFLLENALQMD